VEESESAPGTGYEHLRARAHEHMLERGGRCHLHDLIRFMFGATSKPDLWRTLTESILEGDDRLIRLADDVWSMRAGDSDPSAGLESATFVALDVETTGLQPRQHRVIEIGLARYERGRLIEHYSRLVNPERRIPDYINKLTGLADSDLISAQRFSQVAGEIVTFIGDSVLLGHNIGFDISFLNAELDRCRLPTLINRSIDTIPLSTRILKQIRRPSLDRVAKELGLPPRKHHRALGDAELAAEVALRLIGIASQEGIRFDDIVAELERQKGRRRVSGASAGTVLSRSHLHELPRRPGVYLMIDINDRVLYIGKAKSIRDRVASYYAQPLGYTRKMDGLAEAIHRIDHIETGSDLVAQLLESQLIRRHQPPYNTMLRNSESYPYIRIDPANPWPYLRLVNRRRPDGARYYGPFRQRALARDVVALLNRRFGLRTCSRGFRSPASYGNPCLEYDLKRCPGPCIGRADANSYRARVRDLLHFMDGTSRGVQEGLAIELEEATESLAYETASVARRDLELIERLGVELANVSSLESKPPRLIVQPGSLESTIQVLLIAGGIWWSQHVVADTVPANFQERLEASWHRFIVSGGLALDHNSVDESSILRRWERTTDSIGKCIEFDPEARGVWQQITDQVRETARLITRGEPLDDVVVDDAVAI
jgi:DNA polymerase III subunit epsilon